MAPSGFTDPQAGVIATSPATAPEAAPSVVALESRSRSTTSQPATAAAPATWVLKNATAAEPLAASADPALKPNQPNQSSPAPSTTRGMLCGRIGSERNPSRGPSTSASASPDEPELISTTVPPAR